MPQSPGTGTLVRQSSFGGGISDDPRAVRFWRKIFLASDFIITKHFDIFSNPQILTPYRDLTADTNDGSSSTGMKQYYVRDFVYASASAKLYGLGQTAGGLTEIFQKADATTGNWSVPSGATGSGAVQNGCFVEYKDYLWGFQGSNQVWKWGLLSGTPSFTDTVTGTLASAITSVAQGVIALDDNLYLPYNNVLVRVNAAGTMSDAVLTLPTNFKITSICNYGKYLAIACAPISTFNGKSKVFLWNLTSTDVQESIDWGDGELRILETIEGMLVGVTDRYLNNSTGAGKGSMIIQTYSGGSPQVVKEIFTQALTGKTMPLSKAVKNNRLFWSAKIMTNTAGTTYNEGIWSYGRKNASHPFALTLDIIDENVNTSGIQAFGTAASYFFIAFNADGSIDKTSATATYSFTSILESQIFNFGSPNETKKLLKFSLFTTPLPANASLTVKLKVNNDANWTTFGTFTTLNSLARDFINIESTGANFPTFNEIKFRIESVTGGAEITGFSLEASQLIGLQ